jgi:4-amino-4-deoxy-L-arabinose transferase-like glycosyltransferase
MKKQWTIAICLLLISILVRFPYYFVDVVNWDESTFILMGQSLLDGHLPYTELWDIKPPLAFAAYALFIVLLGKSIVAIRLAGTLCVFLTSWFVYLIGKYLGNSSAGIFAGIMTIFTVTAIDSGQATMTEHVACVLLLGSLAWLITHKMTPGVLFFGGILLTGAALVRLNLAYVVFGVGIWLLYSKFKHHRVQFRGIVAYCLGSFGLILLTYLPYLNAGDSLIWLNSVVLVPLSYASHASSTGQMETGKQLLAACLIFWILNQVWQTTSSKLQQEFSLLQVFLLSTVISIIRGGELYEHYCIQIFPLLALTLALFWTRLPKISRLLIVTLVALGLLATVKPIYTQYQVLGDRLNAGKPLNHGVAYEIADYLQQNNAEQKPVYMMQDQLVYWLTNLQPLSKVVTHPSNLSRDYLFKYIEGAAVSTEAELSKILAQKPKFIVRGGEDTPYIEDHPAAHLLLEQVLTTEYKLAKKIGDREIYSRRK